MKNTKIIEIVTIMFIIIYLVIVMTITDDMTMDEINNISYTITGMDYGKSGFNYR